jgi:large subunit ribosomal protein L22
MEVTARLSYLQASPQKVRLVADLIRGKGVQEAAHILELTRKSASKDVAKLLRSAIANAESRDEKIDVDRLFVKTITVDGGPALKRVQAATMGRAFRILKRQSHVTIRLDTAKSPADSSAAATATKAPAAAPARRRSAPAAPRAKAASRKTAKKKG